MLWLDPAGRIGEKNTRIAGEQVYAIGASVVAGLGPVCAFFPKRFSLFFLILGIPRIKFGSPRASPNGIIQRFLVLQITNNLMKKTSILLMSRKQFENIALSGEPCKPGT